MAWQVITEYHIKVLDDGINVQPIRWIAKRVYATLKIQCLIAAFDPTT